jgi:hypothetical protein
MNLRPYDPIITPAMMLNAYMAGAQRESKALALPDLKVISV